MKLMKLDEFVRGAYINAKAFSKRLAIQEISKINKATNMKGGRFRIHNIELSRIYIS